MATQQFGAMVNAVVDVEQGIMDYLPTNLSAGDGGILRQSNSSLLSAAMSPAPLDGKGKIFRVADRLFSLR